MVRHRLKTRREPFEAILDGRKRHEIRVDDRCFAPGDELLLCEWDPDPPATCSGEFTGREIRVRVTYMTPGGTWGLPADLCVMTIEIIPGESCADRSPPWFTGRWRDWHRGHGCDKDDRRPRTPEGQAEIERGPA